jgi:hypothetical protein
MLKYLWYATIPATFWIISIFHHLFGPSLLVEEWYSFPLLVTYGALIILSIVIAVCKVVD